MKTLLKYSVDYTFNAAAGTITFNFVFEQKKLLLVTNTTSNIIIYNFADPNLGGSVSSYQYSYPPYYAVFSLDYDTSSMSNFDQLQIYYDNGLEGASNEVLDALYEISTRLEFLAAVRGVSADLRVSPLSTPNMATLTTLSNLAAIGGWSANTEVKNWDNLTAINSNINNVG